MSGNEICLKGRHESLSTLLYTKANCVSRARQLESQFLAESTGPPLCWMKTHAYSISLLSPDSENCPLIYWNSTFSEQFLKYNSIPKEEIKPSYNSTLTTIMPREPHCGPILVSRLPLPYSLAKDSDAEELPSAFASMCF